MSTLKPWQDAGTIGAGLQGNKEMIIGNRVIAIRSIKIVNETRPLADPRPCWANIKRGGETDAIEICLGGSSQYNDFVKVFPEGMRVGSEDILQFSQRGENGDTYQINVTYEVITLD